MSNASANQPLPISTTPQAPHSEPESRTMPPIANPAFRTFFSRFAESTRSALSHRRPWLEMMDRSAMARPSTLSEATARLRKNYSYFRVNYFLVIGCVLAFSLLSNPFSLLLLLLLSAAWIFLYLLRPADPPLVILGRTFSDRETLGALVAFTVVVVFLTSVGSTIISALLLGLAIVATHGSFRVPEDLFLDEQPDAAPTASFLSFLGGAAANAAATPAPAVATRV